MKSTSVRLPRQLARLAPAALLALASSACQTPARAVDPAIHAAAYAGNVEAGCARCRFQADEPGCDLAIRVDGRTWLVTGTSIDDHGDAHAADGLCNATRRARVVGRFEGDRFAADEFELIPEKP